MLVKEGRHKDLLLIREKEKLVMNILKKNCNLELELEVQRNGK